MRALVQSPKALGRVLRDARHRTGLTQAQLAEVAGTTQTTISQVESGLRHASLGTLLRILPTLDLELVVQARGAGAAGAKGRERP